jgi:hypothetical protein
MTGSYLIKKMFGKDDRKIDAAVLDAKKQIDEGRKIIHIDVTNLTEKQRRSLNEITTALVTDYQTTNNYPSTTPRQFSML